METSEIYTVLQATDFTRYKVAITISGDDILLVTKKPLQSDGDFASLIGLKSESRNDFWCHSLKLSPLNAYTLRHLLPGKVTSITPGVAQVLREYADKVPAPVGTLSEDKKQIELKTPRLKLYRDLFTRLGAYPGKEFYKLRIDKLVELELALEGWKSKLPPIQLSKAVLDINSAPIRGFDGTIDSLKEIPIGILNIVQANIQNWKALKKSKVTLEEKLTKLGIGTLHDLLFRLPRRYIDKSRPQLIDDLIEGEKATVIGRIKAFNEVNGKVSGLRITVEDSTGEKITATFWRQIWLKNKFKIGDEVILNGAVSFWSNKPQLSGDSIEHFDEGITMPVVPIYRQSEAAGVTSGFIIAAVRELLKRMGDLKLPAYFKNTERTPMKEVLEQLHFPSDLDSHSKAVLDMAYYELVYMQLIIQHEKDSVSGKPGVSMVAGTRQLQKKAAASLPYSLTDAQKKATIELNSRLKASMPASSLLLADVGSGKTLTAQLACMRAIDAGKQAVFVSPTDVLARQIYSSTLKLVKGVEEKFGDKITVELLVGGLKATERKEILRRLKEQEIDILVGTQAVLSDAVVYKDLGLIVIDEQQKFGAEQRSKLLEARGDGLVPDLLMQTATPIPRTTAQVYYGDVDIIKMEGKPPGRTPIVTEWIQEDPQMMLQDALHPVWLDCAQEASKGNQTFVIAPMVVDSSKIDAASVERAYKELSKSTLRSLRVGFVHGAMKAEDQRETMRKFRDRELDVLVASTVIEVGVDIPDATRVVILSADRLGASSLHQIRGRVGRSSKASKCYLVSLGKTEHAERRIQALVDSEDGFEIAKVDLEVRGEGTMFSTNQAGRSDMIFAKLSTHADLILEAKAEAIEILNTPFKGAALRDAHAKYDSPERLF